MPGNWPGIFLTINMAKEKKLKVVESEITEKESVNTEPVVAPKKQLRFVRQKMHYFSSNKSIGFIDETINAWMEEKFRSGQNPMMFKQLIDSHDGITITTLFTETIEE